MVADIANRLGRECDVTVYTLTSFPKSSYLENAKICSWDKKNLKKYFTLRDYRTFFGIVHQKVNSRNQLIKNLRSYLVSKDILRLLSQEKFDIIHGASFSCLMAGGSC